MTSHTPIQDLLAAAVRAAADVAQTRVGRGVQLSAGTPTSSTALLRFDLQFEGDARLTWYVSNEDATGFSDLLIGGSGDRGAVLTEMHLDALSGVFSDMLDRAVEGLNGGLRQSITAGGVDMGMDGGLPAVEPGDEQIAFALMVDGFGQLTIVEHANAAMVLLLESLLDPSRAPMVGGSADQGTAQPAGQAQPAVSAGGAAAPQADGVPPDAVPRTAVGSTSHDGIDNVVPLPNLGSQQPPQRRDLRMLLNVPLRVTVELGRTERTIRELLELNVGSILELAKLAGDPMDIMVNGRVLARGEVVVIDEEFGIRVTEISSPEERIQTGLG